LIQEYVENGTLLAYVNQHEHLPEIQARRLFTQLISALEYLHSTKMVMHRDIKAENVLLDEHWNVRLIDFGLSHAFTQNNPRLHTACGSPAYAAPEMIVGHSYTKAADIWSAGITLFVLLAGKVPLKIEYPEWFTPGAVNLLNRMLVAEPAERITIAEIRSHGWFAVGYRKVEGNCGDVWKIISMKKRMRLIVYHTNNIINLKKNIILLKS
jgi:carbon catabolite-derepressing protein kinase